MKLSYPQNRLLACIVFAATLITFSSAQAAGDRRVPTERFIEYAEVLDVQPVYREIRTTEPRPRCWTEQERHIVGYERIKHAGGRHPNRHQNRQSTGNTIVGGLIGGVIGNQLGRGHSSRSRTGATVAGAIIGSAIGNDTNQRNARNIRHQSNHQVRSTPIYETRNVQRCKRAVEARTQSQLQHYNVTYRYRGRTFVTQLPRDPGRQLELQVSVSPARTTTYR